MEWVTATLYQMQVEALKRDMSMCLLRGLLNIVIWIRLLEDYDQLLGPGLAFQAQNEEFATLFSLEDYKVSMEKCFKQIQAAITKYREIKENINEGLKFYVTLQQCSDFVMTLELENLLINASICIQRKLKKKVEEHTSIDIKKITNLKCTLVSWFYVYVL